MTLGSPGRAQNLLSNPDVVGTTAPWAVCEGGKTIFDDHTERCTDSGSVLTSSPQTGCTFTVDEGYNQLAIFQCVALAGTGVVPGSTTLYYGVWVLLGRPETTMVAIRYFASGDCTGTEIGSNTTQTLIAGSQWVRYPFDPTGLTVPATTASIEFRVAAWDPIDTTPFLGGLDGAYLGTRPLLFDDGLEHGSSVPCNWSSYSP